MICNLYHYGVVFVLIMTIVLLTSCYEHHTQYCEKLVKTLNNCAHPYIITVSTNLQHKSMEMMCLCYDREEQVGKGEGNIKYVQPKW
jgi:hypothetical protein